MPIDQVSLIITSLERIDAKLDKHDDKFDNISKALETLIKVDIETRENKDAIGRLFKRVEVLENAHNKEGCSICQQLDARHKKIFERLDNIEKKPLDNIDLVKKGFLGAIGVGAYTWFVAHFLK